MQFLHEGDVLARDVRWDAEPDWFTDFTKVGLCCRLDGLFCGLYNLWLLARKNNVSEVDPERLSLFVLFNVTIGQEIDFPNGEDWRDYSLREFYRAGRSFQRGSPMQQQDEHRRYTNFFVRVGA